MDNKIDLHIHSRYSDGQLEPADIVRMYHEKKYDQIAITDHDGIDGVNEALIAGKALKMEVLTGIEFSTEYNGMDVHLLGYKFDPKNEALLLKTRELRENRRNRNERMLREINRLGYELDIEELEKQSLGAYVGKPNIARLMVEKGYINTEAEAFREGGIFERPEIKAIKKTKPSTEEGIKIILEAGGIPVLAHPGKLKGLGERESDEFFREFETVLLNLKKAGLKGLEVFYKTHSEREVYVFSELAGKYHLHMTTGSDFHGNCLD